jgi:hypothetical protein
MRGRVKAYVKAVSSTVLGRNTAGRELTVFPDDIFLVSYLRSGSTWARFLFGNLIYQGESPVTFANLNRLVPMIYDFPDRVLRSLPRILKSHECFDPRYPRVVHIVRDPRDVAVSLYYYNLKVRELADGFPMDEFVTRFIAAHTVGYADRLGSWEDHTLSWLRLRQGRSNYQLIRYEDLLSDPAKELTKVAPLLGICVTPDRVERAVDLSSADHMRSLEQKQWTEWRTTKGTREDIPFVREAKSGGWRKRLSEASVKNLEEAWGATMQTLGYELAGSSRLPEQAACTVEKPYATR